MKKKIFKITMLLMILTILGVGQMVVVQAGNYMDRYFTIYYSGDGADVSTSSRGKWDYTSSYLYNYGSDTSVYTRVYATNTEAERGGFTLLRDCTYGPMVLVNVGEWKYLPNLVKERGYNYCTILMTPNMHLPHTLRGCWSPDSI